MDHTKGDKVAPAVDLARVGYEGLQRLHLLVDLAPPPLHQLNRRASGLCSHPINNQPTGKSTRATRAAHPPSPRGCAPRRRGSSCRAGAPASRAPTPTTPAHPSNKTNQTAEHQPIVRRKNIGTRGRAEPRQREAPTSLSQMLAMLW
jgi:hypothetical protein